MELKLDDEAMTKALTAAVEKSIEQAAGQWELKNELTKAVAEALSRHDVVGKVRVALDATLEQQAGDVVKRTLDGLAVPLAAAMRAAVLRVCVEMVMSLENPGYLSESARAQLAKDVRAKLEAR